MTNILFGGGEMGAFFPSDGAPQEDANGANVFFDPAYCRCALSTGSYPNTASYLESSKWTSTDDIWVHYTSTFSPTFNLSLPSLQVFDDSNTPVFQIIPVDHTAVGSSVQAIIMQVWNGSAWVQAGNSFMMTWDYSTFDIHLHSTGVEIYINGTQRDFAVASYPHLQNFQSLRLCNPCGDIRFSEIIVADGSTISMRLQTIPPTANGDVQQWDGNYTDINEIVYDDGLFISTDTAAQVSTFAQSSVLNSDDILAIIVTARAATNAVAPQNLQLVLEEGVGGTQFFSPSFLQGPGYGATEYVWNVDPNGNVPWVGPVVQQLLYGGKSIA